MDLKWQDAEDIAIRLVEEHPDADPLAVRLQTCMPGSSPYRILRMTRRSRMKRFLKPFRWPGTKSTKTHKPDPSVYSG